MAKKAAKFRIGLRLFLAVFLSFLVVGIASIVTIRWSLLAEPAVSTRTIEPDTAAVIGSLETSFKSHGDWEFLPAEPPLRRRWLRTQWIDTVGRQDLAKFVDSAATFGDRIALVDSSGRILSGTVPGPFIRALGSIDTRWVPIFAYRRRVGYLVIAGADDANDKLAVAFLLQNSGRFAFIAGSALVFSIILAALLAAHFRRPIGKLVGAARMLEKGNFETRMDDSRRDELGELAGAFNQMAARLEHAELARRQWVADTSHELRTPLAVLRAQIESFQDGIRLPTVGNLRTMLVHVESMSSRVDDLYALAQADMAEVRYDKQAIDLWPIVRSVTESFLARATTARLTISIEADAPRCSVICDGERMRQVFVNLVENAVRYTDAGGRIEICGRVEGQFLFLTIDDTAPAVSEPSIQRLGERFFRTDRARAGKHGGAGLGLALARQIVLAHGGQIKFAHSRLGGLQTTISMPLSPA